jgi:hypothetical protein
MISPTLLGFLFLFSIAILTSAQSAASSGYVSYNFSQTGDPSSVVSDTADTTSNVSTAAPPNVYLNATVFVGEIDITVANLTAKISLDAQVLSLLQFSAGVNVNIDRVSLFIQQVSAKVLLLEARLENIVLMIDDVLNSLDLNPVLATLGQAVGSIANTTVSGQTGSGSSVEARSPLSYNLANNILYSVNDYSGYTHSNRILAQNGSIVDEFLDNDGNVHSQQIVGYYSRDMMFNGYNQSAVNGLVNRELEYVYAPFTGLSVVSAIYINSAEQVVATRVLSESGAGGSSTVGQ